MNFWEYLWRPSCCYPESALKAGFATSNAYGGAQVMWMFEIGQFEQSSSLAGGKGTFYLFLKHGALWVKFYFSHLWNRLRVHAVVSFPLNSTVRRMKVTESADSPLPLDLHAAMTTGSDGHCRRVACWFLIQKRNGPLALGKRWHADRARSRKWQENPVSLPRRELFILFGGERGGRS